jgi:hypothetical protein
MKKIVINLSNKLYFALLLIIFLSLLGVGVYAYGTFDPAVFGHSSGEIEDINWSQISGIPDDLLDGDDGIITESDPTVLASVKNGITWSEIGGSCPCGTCWVVNSPCPCGGSPSSTRMCTPSGWSPTVSCLSCR